MARRKKGGDGHAGGHGWFVTFADLMALLMSFFVMIAAYSTQDQKKLQLVAGSMRDAFGTTKESRYAGIVEQDGIPVRNRLNNPRDVPPEQASDRPNGATTPETEGSAAPKRSHGFALAAASLRQALQDLPEIGELSRSIVVESTPDGLNVALVDQDGRSMFAPGSVLPTDRTRKILEGIAPALRRLGQRVSLTGHTAAPRPGQRPEGPAWDLSSGRAAAAREILAAAGVPDDRFAFVAGKADTEPMFPDNPYIAANRRVTLQLMNEAPALPYGAKP